MTQPPAAETQPEGADEAEATPKPNGVNQIKPTKFGVPTSRPQQSQLIDTNAVLGAVWATGVDIPSPVRVEHLDRDRLDNINEALRGKKKKSVKKLPAPRQYLVPAEPRASHQQDQTQGSTIQTAATPTRYHSSFSPLEHAPQDGHVMPSSRKETEALHNEQLSARHAPDLGQYTIASNLRHSYNEKTKGEPKPHPSTAHAQPLRPYASAQNVSQSHNERIIYTRNEVAGPWQHASIPVSNQPLHAPHVNTGLSVVEQAIQEARQRMGYMSPPPMMSMAVPQPVLRFTNPTSITGSLDLVPPANRNLAPPAFNTGHENPVRSKKRKIVRAEVINLTMDNAHVESAEAVPAKRPKTKLNAGLSCKMSELRMDLPEAGDDIMIPETNLRSTKKVKPAKYANASSRVNQQKRVMKYWNLEYYPELTDAGRLKYH